MIPCSGRTHAGYTPGSTPSIQNEAQHWYAVYTLPRHERSVADHLHERGLETFLPFYTEQRIWNDRRVNVEMPLFPGYVFVQMHLANKSILLSRPGVIRIVSFGSVPAVIPDEDIAMLRSTLKTWRAAPYPFLAAGSPVRIKAGPFAGLCGKVIRRDGKFRLVVALDMIQSAIALEVSVADAQRATRLECA